MFPMNRKPLCTTVQFTNAHGQAEQRTFPTAGAAKRFYALQLQLGRSPQVVAARLKLPKRQS